MNPILSCLALQSPFLLSFSRQKAPPSNPLRWALKYTKLGLIFIAHTGAWKSNTGVWLPHAGAWEWTKKIAPQARKGIGATQGHGPLCCFISSCLCTTITLSPELGIARSWTLRKDLEVRNPNTLRTVPSDIIL